MVLFYTFSLCLYDLCHEKILHAEKAMDVQVLGGV